MESYGFKTDLPANTMSLSEYKNFKAELYNTTTIDELNTIKNKYPYTTAIKIKLLEDLLNDDKKDNSILFTPNVFISMIEKSVYVANTTGLERAKSIFKNHISGLIKNKLIMLLTLPLNGKYTTKLKKPIGKITKLLLFAHGDYSSMYIKDLSDLISEIKRKLIALGLSSTILVYTYDINDLILPDFSSKDALASFTAKFGKFDCIVPINCFNPKSFDYGELAKRKWKQFVENEFVNVINNNVTPDGYIITVGAEMDGEYGTFLNFYKDIYHIVNEQHGTNTLHIIALKNKILPESVKPVKKNNSSEEKAKRDAEQAKRDAEQAKRDAEEKANREAEEKAKREAEEKANREAEEKGKRDAEQAKRDAEEKGKRDAEEKGKRDAEEKANREAEEKAKREAEEKANREAEEKGKRDAEQAKRDAEEKAKRDAEEKAKRDAEEKAKRDAEEKAKRDAKYTSPKKSYTGIEESKINFIKYAST